MPKRTKPKTTIVDDDDDDAAIETDDTIEDAESIAHVLSQLAGAAGTWATVHRVRDNGKIAHVARVTDLDAFDLDTFGRTYGAGDYRMAFYRTGTKGMVAPVQSFSIDESFGKPSATTPSAMTPAAARNDERSDRLFELIITQSAESSRQLQSMMIASQQQMTGILTALIGAKGTPATELASLLQVTRELSPPATDALTEGVRALPEIAKAVAASEHRPTPEQIGRARRIRARRRLLAQKKAGTITQAPSAEVGTGLRSSLSPPGSETIVEPRGEPPPPLPTTIEGVQAEVISIVRRSIHRPLIAANAILERFGLDNTEAMLNAQADGALTDQLAQLAPDLDGDAIAAIETLLRVAVFGEPDDTPPGNEGALSDEPAPIDAVQVNGRVKLAA